MSGTSARESYRSGKRTRPSDSQPTRMTPPVLFRLPSVAMPAQEPAADASNMNSVAMAMPVATAAAIASSSVASQASSSMPEAAAPSAPAQTAAATVAAKKASGQRLLNTIIVVLLIAALAVIAWVSLNRPTAPPAMANNKFGNDSALDTLGELKVPDVTSGSLAETPKPKTEAADSGLNLDEIKPANPSDLSLIDLPVTTKDDLGDGDKPQAGQPGSLLVGIDTSSTSDSAASTAKPTSTPTAQIQLRTPVPVGNSNVSSLVDSQRSGSQLGNPTLGSSTTAPVQTVSTPAPATKVFPANPAFGAGSANTNNPSTSGTSSTNGSPTNSASGNSPSLYDEAKRQSVEDLQLGGKPSAGSAGTQVNISRPLSAEVAMPGLQTPGSNQPSTSDVAHQAAEPTTPDGGVTVGAGETAPYRLGKSRFDLDPVTFARIKASGADKSAVSGATPTSQTPINSYAGATPAAPGQNLYDGNYVKPAPGNSTPINSYAKAVPPGMTGNGTTAYVPPTASTGAANNQYVANPYSTNQYSANPTNPYPANPNGTNQYGAAPYPGPQALLTHGSNTVPASTAGYSVPARGAQSSYGPTNAAAPTGSGYYQPNFNPSYQQPVAPAQGNAQPQYVPSNYSQPNYGQAAMAPYGQPNSAYGNPAYASPSMNMPTGYQGAASYPTKSLYPGGQAPVGMIGPAGPATKPTGDVTPVPVMGRGGVGTSTPYGAPQ